MEEEGKITQSGPNAPPLKKKYTMTWRNKWITESAGNIDDFIKTYEHLAEMMRRWKSDGITLDPDIIGGIGDDYAQFCTYDEKVALKEGFEEEIFEEDEDDFDSETIDKFQINEFLSVKLIGYTQKSI